MTDATRAELNAIGAGAGGGWMLLGGIVSVVVAVMAFLAPFSATLAATAVIGFFLIGAGIASLIGGVAGRGHEGRGYAIALGVLSLVVGLATIFRPLTGAISLTLLVAIWLGVRGLLEIVLGARFRRGRTLMIVLGVINIVLAVIVLTTLPFSALTLPGYILGISFLLGGVNAIGAALAHRSGAPAFAARS